MCTWTTKIVYPSCRTKVWKEKNLEGRNTKVILLSRKPLFFLIKLSACTFNTFPSLTVAILHPKLRPAVPREGCLYIYISEVQLVLLVCTVQYTIGSDGCRGHRAQSRAVIRQSSNYRPATTTGGLE